MVRARLIFSWLVGTICLPGFIVQTYRASSFIASLEGDLYMVLVNWLTRFAKTNYAPDTHTLGNKSLIVYTLGTYKFSLESCSDKLCTEVDYYIC